jgi:putative toxin-antitoxin system antitoxin component (TIGR02293 family)
VVADSAHLIRRSLAVEVVERVAEVLGGRSILRRRVRTWDDLDRVVRAGLPKRSLQLVARRALEPGMPPNEFVYSVVPAATFKRRHRLSAEESARTERLARIVALAESLWEKEEDARAFLNRPHPLLGGEPPLRVARTELGARRVENLLHDVEHGLPL